MKYFERLKIAASAVDVLKRYGIYAVLLVLIIFFAIAIREFFSVPAICLMLPGRYLCSALRLSASRLFCCWGA